MDIIVRTGKLLVPKMPKKPTTPQHTKDDIIVSAAKVTSAAAGKSASPAGATPEAPPHATPMKKGKLPKKHKHRLPRRQKKERQKLKQIEP
jgi:hypothetical protein